MSEQPGQDTPAVDVDAPSADDAPGATSSPAPEPAADPTDDAHPAPVAAAPVEVAEPVEVTEPVVAPAGAEVTADLLDEPPADTDAAPTEPASSTEDAASSTEGAAASTEGAASSTEGAAPADAAATDEQAVAALKTELLAEAEAIAAVPDHDESGKAPDDRALTDRLRVVENRWLAAGSAGPQESDLRRRYQAAKSTYAVSRSRRAESRGVDRARAGETKKALLVEAFALSQLALGTSLSQLAGRRPGDAQDAVAAGTAPDADAAEPDATDSSAAIEPAATETSAATEPAATETSPVAESAATETGVEAEDSPPSPGDEPMADAPPAAAEDTSAPEAPADDATPADVAPEAPGQVDDVATAEGSAAGETPVAETSVGDESARDAPADDVPVTDVPADDVPADDVPADDVPVDAAPAGDAPADGAPAGDVPAGAAPVAEPTGPAPSGEPAHPGGGVDIQALARRAKELQSEWTSAGFAGREVENELQPLFRRYLQVVFDKQRKDTGTKAASRRKLVTAARGLAEQAAEATPGQLQQLVRQAKQLQQQWKDEPAAPRSAETGAWRQFSGALREVFAAREKLAETAKADREDIVAKAAALVGGRDPMRAVRDLGPLLRRWREAGPVSTPVYEELKKKLDQAAGTIRSQADSERARRDAEDSKSQAERAKNASKIIKEAGRGRGAERRPERPASAAAQGALAAALAEAFGRAERVAEELRRLEATVTDLRDKLARAEAGQLGVASDDVETSQGFTIRSSADAGAANPTRLRAELEQAEQALTRRQGELAELTSSAKGLGLKV